MLKLNSTNKFKDKILELLNNMIQKDYNIQQIYEDFQKDQLYKYFVKNKLWL